MMRKVREIAKNFDFMKSGQAIMSARKKQQITQEELAGELGISARHLQYVEKKGGQLFIQLVMMFYIPV